MYLLKRKQIKKSKSTKGFWMGFGIFYHETEKERETLEKLLWIFTCSYSATIDFL